MSEGMASYFRMLAGFTMGVAIIGPMLGTPVIQTIPSLLLGIFFALWSIQETLRENNE